MLDMKEMKEEDIIKKALTSGLTDKEKEFLAGREPVLRHLKEQWNEPGDSFLSPVAGLCGRYILIIPVGTIG